MTTPGFPARLKKIEDRIGTIEKAIETHDRAWLDAMRSLDQAQHAAQLALRLGLHNRRELRRKKKDGRNG